MEEVNFEEIFVVTNRHLCDQPFLKQIELLCKKRPKGIILREKDLPEDTYEELAIGVKEICDLYKIPLVLHFYLETAKHLGIKRIHLPLWKLEAFSEEKKQFFDVIGVSTHSLLEARKAEKLGASYITAGHVFATDCKKGLPPRGLDFLREICEGVQIPVFAIGGISLSGEQMKKVKAQGAKGSCIMSATMQLKE